MPVWGKFRMVAEVRVPHTGPKTGAASGVWTVNSRKLMGLEHTSKLVKGFLLYDVLAWVLTA